MFLRIQILVGLLILSVLIAGCSVVSFESRDGSTAVSEESVSTSDTVVDQGPMIISVSTTASIPNSAGSVLYGDKVQHLTSQQEQLLLDYMEMYYQSLAKLQVANPIELFAADAQENAAVRQSVWQVIVDVRKAHRADLSLADFSYELTCTNISRNDDGDIVVSAGEKSVQSFAMAPGIASESYNIRHRFTLTETPEGWRLRSHSQMDSTNMVALGRASYRGLISGDAGGRNVSIEEQQERVLSAHMSNIAFREGQRLQYASELTSMLSHAYDYDRGEAVSYAMKWVEERNSENWPSYDRNGGNCMNFVSQCMLAGGIPMDYFGTSQWKWYGSSPNVSQAATGRSASWSGVKEFYSYTKNNTGYGMVAEPDANYWSGEPGDLIQYGYDGDWRHVVIITGVVRDEEGNTVDYLINSNTADQRSYPAGAYLYPQQRLIKIYGWNEK